MGAEGLKKGVDRLLLFPLPPGELVSHSRAQIFLTRLLLSLSLPLSTSPRASHDRLKLAVEKVLVN